MRPTLHNRLRTVPVTVAIAPVTLASGCGSDQQSVDTLTAGWSASSAATGAQTTLAVSLTNDVCDPTTLAAPAGDITFSVANAVDGTDLKSEFELLTAKPKILAEEFFEKGETRDVKVTIASGDYQLIFGAPSNLRALLAISGEARENTAALTVGPAALKVNVDAYTEYVDAQLTGMVASNKALYDAIASGDLPRAQALYMPARVQRERIEPIAELFPNSDAVLDSRVDDFEAGPLDPGFTGWHRLEWLMFDQKTLDGAKPFAAALVKNINVLVADVHGISIDATTMINGAAALIEEAATGKITGEEERYAGTSLLTFASNVEGAKKIIDFNADLLRGANPTATLSENLSAAAACFGPEVG